MAEKKKFKIQHWIIIDIFLLIYDFISIYIAYFLALLLRFDFRFNAIEAVYLTSARNSLTLIAFLYLFSTYFFRLYNSIWRFASVNELGRCLLNSLTITTLNIIITIFFFNRMPISYYAIGAILQFIFSIGIRFSYRFALLLRKRLRNFDVSTKVLVIGGGEAGTMIVKDINENPNSNEKVACIIDDNPNKWNRYIGKILIYGGMEKLDEAIRKYHIDKIVIAIPSASKSQMAKVIKAAKETGKETKIIPSLYSLTHENITTSKLKDVEISDLLDRDEIKTDLKGVFKFIKNKVVLITGAGGSIGSELARQIAANNPKQLILFDIYENSTYNIQLELRKKYPGLSLITLIGSVRDYRKVNEVFEEYQPDMVYHAAAHKHVPLMEDSPNEAIKNNCFGTFNVAMAALVYGTKRFLLISTDKAVNPTNIMGASKRICEMIIQDFNKNINYNNNNNNKAQRLADLYNNLYGTNLKLPKKLNTIFSAVRFGNVLGSNGSVVPLFKEQIAKGGPVTVTDERIVRYFMTIPEAVSLVLQASVYAEGGEIFVLDMGEPVKIVDLARTMIELSGKTLEEIPIIFTGLRPGEKLYEERLMDIEDLRETPNKLISICKPLDIKTTAFFNALKKLYKTTLNNSSDTKQEVAKIVTTYVPED